ncbi:MAG: four helix bundle protein [Cyclobacteriaceae bacterium]|nr:four helix bundle protein [Cyclobacteriaceae bacterium]
MGEKSFRDLTVYKKAFHLAMEIFNLTKKFPAEEKYSLTDQVRRSSRSVCSCIGEAYKKRQYEAHFVSKSTDADMENTETRVWLDFALACEYISQDEWKALDEKATEIGKLVNHMIENPNKYLTKSQTLKK